MRKRIRRFGKWTKGIILLFIIGFLWFSIHTVIIIVDGLNDDLEKVDVAVVLGNKVELNGEPSKRLKARLDIALKLYQKNYFDAIIVSGGVGAEGFDESEIMRDYLVGLGVPSNHVITDSNGYNTEMTAENSREIMANRGMNSALVVTQYYHITRTKLAFRQEGIEKVYSAHAEIFEWRDPYSIFREFFAYYKYLIDVI